MSERKASILITGGSGYLGGRLALHFLEAGYPVRVTAFNSARSPGWVPNNAELFRLDLESTESCRRACIGMNSVVHCAGLNEIECEKDPEAAERINTLGTLKLIRAAEEAGARRFVYFSTAHVYGAALQGRIDERTLTHPVHPYSSTHRAAEEFVGESHARSSLQGVVVRLSNAYGWPVEKRIQRWTLLVNDLCRQAILNRRLVLRTSGTQQRNFVTISDVCEGIDHLLSLDKRLLTERIFNLGGMHSTSIMEMALKVADLCESRLGYRPPIERPLPLPNEQVEGLDYRIDRILATGFSPRGNADEEISELLRRCKDWFGECS